MPAALFQEHEGHAAELGTVVAGDDGLLVGLGDNHGIAEAQLALSHQHGMAGRIGAVGDDAAAQVDEVSAQGQVAVHIDVEQEPSTDSPVQSWDTLGAGKDAVSKASNPWKRTPMATQVARWKALQQTRLKGLSLRAIARELGVSRVTVRKYAYAEQPPTKKLSAQERAKLMALRKSATIAN